MEAGGPELPVVLDLRPAAAADHPRWATARARPPAASPASRPAIPKGYLDGFAALYAEIARALRAKRAGKKVDADVYFPTVEDGLVGMEFIEAAVASSKKGAVWVKV